MSIELDERQRDAVELVKTAGIGIITGGPGTGKTTCLREALHELASGERPVSVMLMAPTGKAARRMGQVTGNPASTIHRALGFEDGGWAHHAENALPADLVICDEASMLDTELAASLLDAIAEQRTRVIFVGDVNQLPSVGPGRVFGDLINSEQVPTVRLEKVHRQAQKSWVYRNAPRVLAGALEDIELDGEYDDFVFLERDNPEVLRVLLLKTYATEMERLERLHPNASPHELLDMIQILAPMKKGPLGVHTINDTIQEAVHPQDALADGYRPSDGVLFADGDKVLQTRNNYFLGVMNGETGTVKGYQGANLTVEVDDREVTYSKENAQDLLLGYAVTIHKSQGSEWPTVLVVCHSSHRRMLNRQLFYTAITRAKGRLIVVGDREGLERAVRTETVDSRQSRLVERVRYCMRVEG